MCLISAYSLKRFLLGWDKWFGLPIYLNRVALANSETLKLIILGASGTGKSKLLNAFDSFTQVRLFPSEHNELEQGNCMFEYLGARARVEVFATSDLTLDRLLTVYINSCAVVLLTYDLNNLENLKYLEEKYLGILASHRECSRLTVFIVGTKIATSRRNSLTHEISRAIMLLTIAYVIRSRLGARVGVLEVTVDEFASTEDFKNKVLAFLVSE